MAQLRYLKDLFSSAVGGPAVGLTNAWNDTHPGVIEEKGQWGSACPQG